MPERAWLIKRHGGPPSSFDSCRLFEEGLAIEGRVNGPHLKKKKSCLVPLRPATGRRLGSGPVWSGIHCCQGKTDCRPLSPGERMISKRLHFFVCVYGCFFVVKSNAGKRPIASRKRGESRVSFPPRCLQKTQVGGRLRVRETAGGSQHARVFYPLGNRVELAAIREPETSTVTMLTRRSLARACENRIIGEPAPCYAIGLCAGMASFAFFSPLICTCVPAMPF